MRGNFALLENTQELISDRNWEYYVPEFHAGKIVSNFALRKKKMMSHVHSTCLKLFLAISFIFVE